MRYVYVTSARRNSESNVKENRDAEITHYYELDKSSNSSLPVYFVSFTNLPKVGINPNNQFKTPTGIYTYPLRFMYRDIINNTLPFAGDRKYIQIVRLDTGHVLYGNDYTESDYKKDAFKLEKLWDRERNKITIEHLQYAQNHLLDKIDSSVGDIPFFFVGDEDYLTDEEDEFDKDAAIDNLCFSDLKSVAKALSQSSANLNNRAEHPVNLIWGLTQVLSLLLFTGPVHTTKWNSLLRYLGYDVIIDNGLGFIHPHEPTQAVFLIANSLKHVATINNKKHLDLGYQRFRRFENLADEQQYKKLLQANPDIKNIKCSCRLFLDNKTNKVVVSSNGSVIKNTKLTNFKIRIKCKKCKLDNCIIDSYIRIDSCILNKCVGQYNSISLSHLYNSTVTFPQLAGCEVVDSVLSGGNVINSKIKNCTIKGECTFEDTQFINCNFENKKQCEFTRCEFEM